MAFRWVTHAVKRPATGNILPLHFVFQTTFFIVNDFIAVCSLVTLRTPEKSIRGLRWYAPHHCIDVFYAFIY